MGITTFALGAVIILLAGWRFFYIRRHINRGETEFSILPDMFLMSSVLVTVGAVFILFAFFL
jgi:putative membrane protein